MYNLTQDFSLQKIDQLAHNMEHSVEYVLHTKPKKRVLKDLAARSIGYASYIHAKRCLSGHEHPDVWDSPEEAIGCLVHKFLEDFYGATEVFWDGKHEIVVNSYFDVQNLILERYHRDHYKLDLKASEKYSEKIVFEFKSGKKVTVSDIVKGLSFNSGFEINKRHVAVYEKVAFDSPNSYVKYAMKTIRLFLFFMERSSEILYKGQRYSVFLNTALFELKNELDSDQPVGSTTENELNFFPKDKVLFSIGEENFTYGDLLSRLENKSSPEGSHFYFDGEMFVFATIGPDYKLPIHNSL